MLALAGCSGTESSAPAPVAAGAPAPSAAPAPPPAPVADVTVQGGPEKACNRVTASEMSAILGNAVTAVPNDGTEGITSCNYSAVTKGRSAEIMISAGDGASTLRMVREMKNYDPNPGKAFAGVGDDADVLPPGIVIKDGADLFSLTRFGVDDEPAVAKKILAASR